MSGGNYSRQYAYHHRESKGKEDGPRCDCRSHISSKAQRLYAQIRDEQGNSRTKYYTYDSTYKSEYSRLDKEKFHDFALTRTYCFQEPYLFCAFHDRHEHGIGYAYCPDKKRD